MDARAGVRGVAPSLDMTAEEFRRYGHRAVDWIARYLTEVDGYPVLPRLEPGQVRAALPASAPEAGEPFDQVLHDFERQIVPGITHWNHPAFFAYFAVTGSGPGILAEMLSAALNVNAMLWRTSPAATELEDHVLCWLRDAFGLPEAFEGVINDTASSSSLYALAAAREAALPGAHERGLAGGPRPRVYLSAEAHSSIDKATVTLGFGTDGVRRIPTDGEFRMVPEALRAALADDRAAGWTPVAIVATIGTTSTTSVDPVAPIAPIAEEFQAWLHVDAAYAGPAALVPETRPLFAGWERADSIVLNPHKWLFTPIDCSVLYCRRPAALRRAFTVTPEYLRTLAAEPEVRNLMDYGISLGRRFRALKLWFVLRYFGRSGIVERLRRHMELARAFASWVDGAADWTRVAPVPFSTVVFRCAPAGVPPQEQDELNQAILDRVNASGRAFLSHTRLNGRLCLRIAIGNLRTEERHVRGAWELLCEAAREEARSRPPFRPPGGRP